MGWLPMRIAALIFGKSSLGAAGLLSQAEARERLKDLRPKVSGKPLTLHLAHAKQAEEFVGALGTMAQRMMAKLWPGPVGLVFDVAAETRRRVAEKYTIDES